MSATAKKKETEVAERAETQLPSTQVNQAEEIDSSDVILPAIYLMQKMSEWVGEEKARPGEFVKSTNKTVIGGRSKAVEFIPLSFYKSFRIVEAKGNKWVRNENWDPSKVTEWEFKEDTKDLKRIKCINVYALLVPEMIAEQKEKDSIAKSGEMFDLEKALTPVLISFRSSSFKAGKILTDHFARAQQYKSEPYVTTFKLDSHEESNDDGDYYVADVTSSGKTSKENYPTCSYWRGLILKGKTKVVESEETSLEGSEAAGSKQF